MSDIMKEAIEARRNGASFNVIRRIHGVGQKKAINVCEIVANEKAIVVIPNPLLDKVMRDDGIIPPSVRNVTDTLIYAEARNAHIYGLPPIDKLAVAYKVTFPVIKVPEGCNLITADENQLRQWIRAYKTIRIEEVEDDQ